MCVTFGSLTAMAGLKQVEEVTDEMPTNFQIEIIDRLSKKTDKELDEAIKG